MEMEAAVCATPSIELTATAKSSGSAVRSIPRAAVEPSPVLSDSLHCLQVEPALRQRVCFRLSRLADFRVFPARVCRLAVKNSLTDSTVVKALALVDVLSAALQLDQPSQRNLCLEEGTGEGRSEQASSSWQ